ncbi:winged helix DNA-binding protein [Novosphingobium humi]|uniref:Winged helix DNA-binding protein n=1 Tax=Novosphingobium humi TaxID=2282397 RepID=A0ABY7U1E6_9SPHN|nr:winged helix DNA-binding protein [Novosphingobium humi]WCT79131.1 winged helix DNA-binding protein [Novosphingobium humi]
MDSKYYKHWHLATNELEYKVTELEWSIIRCHEAFSRWLEAASAIVVEGDLKISEYLILQVIGMLDRPRNGVTIARMLNRDDVANVQYSLRKLESYNLITKIKENGSKVHAFEVSEKGKKACDEFSVIRRELLIEGIKGLESLNEKLGGATQFLSFLTGVYEEVSRSSASLSHNSTKLP